MRRAPLPVLLALVAACGGGGGGGGAGGGGPPPDPPPPGLAGRVLLPDVHLGRIVEQEPNDTPEQAFRLPPVAARTTLEVTGEVSVAADLFGRVDPVDVLRFVSLEDQDLRLELSFSLLHLIGGASDLDLEVRDAATGVLVGATSGGLVPRSLSVSASAGRALDVHVRCNAGQAGWVLTLRCTDPPGGASLPKVASAATLPHGPAPVPAPMAAPCAPGHVLVRLRPGRSAAALAARFGLQVGRRTGGGSVHLHLPALADRCERPPELAARLVRDPDVLFAEPDWIVRPLAEEVGAEASRQWNLRAVGAPAAWDVTRGDPQVVVGIVDTGLVAHPDLAGQTVPGYDFVSDPAMAGDGDGRDPDPTDPGDRATSSGRSSWHGTHVAAIVAGKGGVSGVAPGCRVMMLRALGIGGGSISDVSDAILYAAGLLTTDDGRRLDTPLRVLNLSFGTPNPSAELADACDRARNVGVFLVGATGNGLGPVLYPARLDSVFAVTAVAGDLGVTGYANFGPEVDLAAPGGRHGRDAFGDGWPDGVLSALVDDTVHPPRFAHGYLVGTSQAAPHVAGAAALLLSVDPSLSLLALRTLLASTALDRGPTGRDDTFGHGLLQTHEALRVLLEQRGTPIDGPPRLLLASTSLRFTGFDQEHRVAVMNAGGGRLELVNASGVTDDGLPWLRADFRMASAGSSHNVEEVVVLVNRFLLPPGPRASGSLRLHTQGEVAGTIRVVVYAGAEPHAGEDFLVVALEEGTGIARATGLAQATHGYRYWLPGLPAGAWRIMAGEDRNGNGFPCEAGDFCGWHGGTTQAEAVVVITSTSSPLHGVDVILR